MYLKPEPFPKASFDTSIVSNAKYALTGSSISELWRSMFIAIMPKYLNYSQRQVLVSQIILDVNFALKLSDLVWKWRTIFETWTIPKGKFWKFNCFKCEVCTNRLLKIWSLIMLAHIILKREMYLIVLFIVSNVKHAHTERICESFEESYHLHPCIKIKIWIIFPQTSLVNSNEFVCEFCT